MDVYRARKRIEFGERDPVQRTRTPKGRTASLQSAYAASRPADLSSARGRTSELWSVDVQRSPVSSSPLPRSLYNNTGLLLFISFKVVVLGAISPRSREQQLARARTGITIALRTRLPASSWRWSCSSATYGCGHNSPR